MLLEFLDQNIVRLSRKKFTIPVWLLKKHFLDIRLRFWFKGDAGIGWWRNAYSRVHSLERGFFDLFNWTMFSIIDWNINFFDDRTGHSLFFTNHFSRLLSSGSFHHSKICHFLFLHLSICLNNDILITSRLIISIFLFYLSLFLFFHHRKEDIACCLFGFRQPHLKPFMVLFQTMWPSGQSDGFLPVLAQLFIITYKLPRPEVGSSTKLYEETVRLSVYVGDVDQVDLTFKDRYLSFWVERKRGFFWNISGIPNRVSIFEYEQSLIGEKEYLIFFSE